jgi:dTMP kinase
MFWVFEGCDGSGKSTIARAVAERLAVDRNVVLTKEPGGSDFGDNLRTLLLGDFVLNPIAEFYGMLSSRAQSLSELIVPSLLEKRAVVLDRFLMSTLVYQGVKGVPESMILQCHEFLLKGLCGVLPVQELNPVYFILDASDEVIDARLAARPKEQLNMWDTNPDLVTKVRAGYRALAKDTRFTSYLVDTSQPLESCVEFILKTMLAIKAHDPN